MLILVREGNEECGFVWLDFVADSFPAKDPCFCSPSLDGKLSHCSMYKFLGSFSLVFQCSQRD